MNHERLFTCYFLHRCPQFTHRLVMIHHDEETLDDVRYKSETAIHFVSFPRDSAGGCLLPLIENFGKDKSAEFFRHLLYQGFLTAKEGYAHYSLDANVAFMMDFHFTREHKRIYDFLTKMYGQAFAHSLSTATMCEGINAVFYMDSKLLWGIDYVQ